MKKTRLIPLAFATLAAVVGAACGGGHGPSVVASGAAPPASPKYGVDGAPDDPSALDQPGQHGVWDWTPAPNFAFFVKNSHAAVKGQVVEMSAPRFNTKDGTPTADERAMVFRDATLAVEDVLYDSSELHVTPGQKLVVRLMGDGTDTGARVDGAGPVKHTNAISGPVAKGDTVLWVLAVSQFPFMNDDMMTLARTEAVPKLFTDLYGAWLVDLVADKAKSIVPNRTVPYRALAARLRAERQFPSDDKRGTRGRENPQE
jgi:hypothetical protein